MLDFVEHRSLVAKVAGIKAWGWLVQTNVLPPVGTATTTRSQRCEMIIGDKARFAIEVLTGDLSCEFADIFIIVSGHRVSGGNPVFFPTFVGELKGFMKSHESSRQTDFDFSAFSDEQAFNLLHEVLETDQRNGCLTPNAVCNYHRLHSLDTSVDGWEIYVFDVADEKHIVCREITAVHVPGENTGPIWSSSLPRKEFLSTLNEFLMLFPAFC